MSIPNLSHYINGERVAARAQLTSGNPSDTRDIVARFPDGSAAELDAAVAAPAPAFGNTVVLKPAEPTPATAAAPGGAR
jgi:aldehyde dehydrogenase (NAD+)